MGYTPTSEFCLQPIISDVPKAAQIRGEDLHKLNNGTHENPFSVLGLHLFYDEGDPIVSVVIRAWVKDRNDVYVRISDLPPVPMLHQSSFLHVRCFKFVPYEHSDPDIFNKLVNSSRIKYECLYLDSNRAIQINDPYSFSCVLPTEMLNAFHSGSCWDVDDLMGSHECTIEGVRGVQFAVWAPNAHSISVVGTWNDWDSRVHPMRKRVEYGVWELFIPNIYAGEIYKYCIHTKDGRSILKIDPYSQEFEVPPKTGCIISKYDDKFRKDPFVWSDEEWMINREKNAPVLLEQPISIYEIHLPSWIRGENNTLLNYREIAGPLVRHMQNMNFTHVELLPPTHHPFDGSWGYQVSGYYAVYSSLGNADDFRYFVNELHRNGIGVFVDLVLAHFIKDEWGLAYYDGDVCYEYTDTREGEHKVWGTKIFNYSRNEVRAFLLGSAYHWIQKYHVDGLRIDAVSAMIHRDHGRGIGEWLPNKYGGTENIEAISLLKELNWVIHKRFPGVFMMAEESSAWKGVTDKVNGLGFDVKWDLGWMNDILSYLCTPPELRHTKHEKLTFRGMYMHDEQWILPLSHDEVVSGKGSLVDKCGFKDTPFWERINVLKALFGFQIGMFGRPLIFMGAEFAQGKEWNYKQSLDWNESKESSRHNVLMYLRHLLYLYKTIPAFYNCRDSSKSLIWVDCDNRKDNLIAWIRQSVGLLTMLLFVCNWSNLHYNRYPLGAPLHCDWEVILNSNSKDYGGDGFGGEISFTYSPTKEGRYGWPACLWVDVPRNSCLILQAIERQ